MGGRHGKGDSWVEARGPERQGEPRGAPGPRPSRGAHRALLVADDLDRVGPEPGGRAARLALVLREAPAEEEEGVEGDLELRRHPQHHRPCRRRAPVVQRESARSHPSKLERKLAMTALLWEGERRPRWANGIGPPRRAAGLRPAVQRAPVRAGAGGGPGGGRGMLCNT